MKLLSLSILLAASTPVFQNIYPYDNLVKQEVLKEAVKVYATPHNKGSITIRSTNCSPLSFYLFDAEGTLVYQTPLKKNDKFTVGGLQQGTYTYHAFKNDESINGGNIIIK